MGTRAVGFEYAHTMKRHGTATRWWWGAVAAAVIVAGCEVGPGAEEGELVPSTPREAYASALERTGLASTALGREWHGAAMRAIKDALPVRMPFVEAGFLPVSEPSAVGYRLEGTRGRRVNIMVELEGDTAALVFMDLFRLSRDSTRAPLHVLSADSGARALQFEPEDDARYLLRIQPELLRGGRYTVRVTADPSLAFPVEGGGRGNIHSYFGDPRDGGNRNHHGVDIFARRGTPALAAAAGRVSSVRTTPRGGKVVWLRDTRRGNALYYAHLDSQHVQVGTVVQPGDTLGFVGNTGNARTTPPHLHFGIYRRGEGPLNPYPFVAPPGDEPAPITADTTLLGKWTRSSRTGLSLRLEPDNESVLLERLPVHAPLRVVAAVGRWYRVYLPDGRSGFVAGYLTEEADAAIRTQQVASTLIRATPRPDAAVVDSIERETAVSVLARLGGYLYVQGPSGRTGWMTMD